MCAFFIWTPRNFTNNTSTNRCHIVVQRFLIKILIRLREGSIVIIGFTRDLLIITEQIRNTRWHFLVRLLSLWALLLHPTTTLTIYAYLKDPPVLIHRLVSPARWVRPRVRALGTIQTVDGHTLGIPIGRDYKVTALVWRAASGWQLFGCVARQDAVAVIGVDTRRLDTGLELMGVAAGVRDT